MRIKMRFDNGGENMVLEDSDSNLVMSFSDWEKQKFVAEGMTEEQIVDIQSERIENQIFKENFNL
jgi:hypothetical protein